MTNIQIILVIIFIVSTIVGYFLINNVPPLLHTPLMSGMNALSGVTLLGAIIATSISMGESNPVLASSLGGLAITLASINAVTGFGVTNRMLLMFKTKGDH